MDDKGLKTTPLNTSTTADQRDRARLTIARNARDAADCARLLAVLGLIEMFWLCLDCGRDRNFDDGGGACRCGGVFAVQVRSNEE